MPTDHDLCKGVCAAAKRLGYKLSKLKSHVGYSFSFMSPTGRPTHGAVDANEQDALTSACKELYPQISNEI